MYHHENNNKKYNENLRQKYVPSASTTKRKQSLCNGKKTQHPVHPNNFVEHKSDCDLDYLEIDVPCDDGCRPSCACEDTELDNTTACKFKFSFYWVNVHKRWMIPHYQRGCIKHCGHPKIKPEHLLVRSAVVLDENNMKIVNDLFATKIRATSTAGLPFS